MTNTFQKQLREIKFFILVVYLTGTLNLYGQVPLAIPDTLSGSEIVLTIRNGSASFYPGYTTNTIGFNGNMLGPTLILNKGDLVKMFARNSLADTTTIHWHGLHVPSESDGGPHTAILPGTVWKPEFVIKDNAATYWYHPHLHGKTVEHVTKGAAGFIIVRDDEESVLKLPRRYGVDDFPILVQSRAFDLNKQFVAKSELDSVILVNGTINPFLKVPAQVVRLRLLNGSTERTYNFGFSGNKQFYQIAGDGGLLDKSVALTRLRLAPGERAEILIDLSATQGQTMSLMSYAAELPNGIIGSKNPGVMGGTIPNYSNNRLNGANFSILELVIQNSIPNPVLVIPSKLILNKPWVISQSNGTRKFTFTSSGGMMNITGPFFINGSAFNMDVINFTVKLNNIEIWQIQNNTGIAHPFHVHGLQFYILNRNGAPAAAMEQGKKDNVLVLPNETVRIITRFEDFSNSSVPYMYHCHLLTHEEDGMMGQFLVSSTTEVSRQNQLGNQTFQLDQNFPNPFNPSTIIGYQIPVAGHVTLKVFDIMGGEIVRLVDEYKQPGYYYSVFNLSTTNNASGIYFYQLQMGGYSSTKKIAILK